MIERATGNDGELQLQRRGNDYELICNGIFLMATYNGAGEREMVRKALQPWEEIYGQAQAGLRVLMGGLGFGLGLQQALRSPLVARLDLLELEEAVIRWNKGALKKVNGNALADPRVQVMQEDMIRFLQKKGLATTSDHAALPHTYHAIILDTDNGPGWLSRPANRFLYSSEGTGLLQQLLLPGGILSVWSASPVPSYYNLLKQQFPIVLEETVAEKTGQTSNYYLAFKARG